jgi:hypothetical protein
MCGMNVLRTCIPNFFRAMLAVLREALSSGYLLKWLLGQECRVGSKTL